MSTERNWKQYQEDVAAYLSALGFETKTDEAISGARGSHNIDVTARYKRAGISLLWIIECKLWKRSVPKEAVLTFQAITADVGADRGLFVAEAGFQKGAVAAATSTNLTLTSLAQLREKSKKELFEIRLRTLDDCAQEYMDRLLALGTTVRYSSNAIERRFPTGLDDSAVIGLTGRLSFMQTSLREAERGHWPAPYLTMSSDIPLFAQDFEEFFQVAEDFLAVVQEALTDLERTAQGS